MNPSKDQAQSSITSRREQLEQTPTVTSIHGGLPLYRRTRLCCSGFATSDETSSWSFVPAGEGGTERTTGYAQVSVQGPGLLHTTQIPVNSQVVAQDIAARGTVNVIIVVEELTPLHQQLMRVRGEKAMREAITNMGLGLDE